ncbi:MAG: glycosyltransferase, partial [Chloroflexi bacterium]|nr:glycosyltransferase [Chloroflexota bacterium]
STAGNKQALIYENRAPFPRAFLVTDVRYTPPSSAALYRLADIGFDPSKSAYLEEDFPHHLQYTPQPGGSVNFGVDTSDYLDLHVTAAQDSLLVLTDPYYPGWQARLDDVPTAIYRADYLFRGVYIPAGTHRLSFHFEPGSFRIGAIISGLTLLLLTLLLLATHWWWPGKGRELLPISRDSVLGPGVMPRFGLGRSNLDPNARQMSIVIACYNCAHYIESSLVQLRNALRDSSWEYELIFIDDGSRDGTRDLLPKLIAGYQNYRLILHEKNYGRGRTIADGIREAMYPIVGFVDIDLATPPHYLPLLARTIANGADVAAARRIYQLSLPVLHRWILSRGDNYLVRQVLMIDLHDTETGCKFFNRDLMIPVLAQSEDERWFWDTEIMVRSVLAGLRVVEIPTAYIHRPELGTTVRLMQDSVSYIKKLLRFRGQVERLRQGLSPLSTLSPEYPQATPGMGDHLSARRPAE